jgi:hypothetical protein
LHRALVESSEQLDDSLRPQLHLRGSAFAFNRGVFFLRTLVSTRVLVEMGVLGFLGCECVSGYRLQT